MLCIWEASCETEKGRRGLLEGMVVVPINSYCSLPVVLKPATPFRLASWLKFKVPRRSGEAAAAAFRNGG